MGWVFSSRPPPLYPQEKEAVRIVQEARWAPGPVWIGAGNLAPQKIRSPDPPVRRKSLYGLCYPGPRTFTVANFLLLLSSLLQASKDPKAKTPRYRLTQLSDPTLFLLQR